MTKQELQLWNQISDTIANAFDYWQPTTRKDVQDVAEVVATTVIRQVKESQND